MLSFSPRQDQIEQVATRKEKAATPRLMPAISRNRDLKFRSLAVAGNN
jgi:hypothetical protein